MPAEKLILAFIVVALSQSHAKTENPKRSSAKLFVQVLAPVKDLLEKDFNKTNQKNDKLFDSPQQDWPTIFYRTNVMKHKKINRRRSKKRVKINNDPTPISEFPTNKRLYKLANKLGFFLRIKENGEIDGTLNPNDQAG